MNFINFLRYLKGYITFLGEGGFTERFFNLASKNTIFIWDACCIENRITAKCNIKDFRKLRHIAKRSGVRLSLTGRYGLIFDLKKQEYRKGLLFGALFFTVFFAVMSRFVWTVDVSGNVLVPKEDILLLAENYGLRVGTYKPSFDETTAANTMAKESGGVFTWAAFNIKGSRAVIEVREQKESIKDTEVHTPSNLVADFDGVIVSFETFSGTSYVSEGMGVRNGDLLIGGVEDNEDFSVSFVEAKGRIIAERDKLYTMRFFRNSKASKISEANKTVTLYIFGLKIPLSPFSAKEQLYFKDESYLSYNKVRLPLGIIIKTDYKAGKAQRNEKEFLLSSLEEYSESAYKFNKNTFLISENPSFKLTDSEMIVKNSWHCLDFMGEKREIIIEN